MNDISVKFTIKYKVLEYSEVQATIRLDIPCYNERKLVVVARDVSVYNEPLHQHWGYYDDENNTRYRLNRIEASTWDDLESAVRANVHDTMQLLRQIVEGYRALVASKPDDRTEIYVF
jgi:hypothetical protein